MEPHIDSPATPDGPPVDTDELSDSDLDLVCGGLARAMVEFPPRDPIIQPDSLRALDSLSH